MDLIAVCTTAVTLPLVWNCCKRASVLDPSAVHRTSSNTTQPVLSKQYPRDETVITKQLPTLLGI